MREALTRFPNRLSPQSEMHTDARALARPMHARDTAWSRAQKAPRPCV